ncbi:MAG TPA: L-2-hydroxyglutarate oxidase [Acidimicrobiia bacterium]|nr:L-2-hydroxyglutarate oxidase [Acidimicrobiia bacterium]
MDRFDVVVVGGGIVGLATARAVAASGRSVAVLEAEERVGTHQTGHNSGVIHSGLYYRPGSHKARLTVHGGRELVAFCEAEGIPYDRCGKVVVATREEELEALRELERRGHANGLTGVRRAGLAELRELEPEVAGIEGLVVPEAGVVDYAQVAARIAERLVHDGHPVMTGRRVVEIAPVTDGRIVATDVGEPVTGETIVACAGLHSDRVARMAGLEPPVRIVPFRGEYYALAPERASLVRALVYPVPDPRFPFLGVHFTRRIDGTVEVGPNAVLAAGRHHYRGSRPDLRELLETVAGRDFLRLARTYWRTGAAEMVRSRSRHLYARAARALIPAVAASDLRPAGAGVRAQALGTDGALIDDFSILRSPGQVHVLNAPSPAATASFAVGRHIAGLLDD